jgi:hypothetical protein
MNLRDHHWPPGAHKIVHPVNDSLAGSAIN